MRQNRLRNSPSSSCFKTMRWWQRVNQIEAHKTEFSRFNSIEEFVMENGWYVPSLHEKYLFDEDIKKHRD